MAMCLFVRDDVPEGEYRMAINPSLLQRAFGRGYRLLLRTTARSLSAMAMCLSVRDDVPEGEYRMAINPSLLQRAFGRGYFFAPLPRLDPEYIIFPDPAGRTWVEVYCCQLERTKPHEHISDVHLMGELKQKILAANENYTAAMKSSSKPYELLGLVSLFILLIIIMPLFQDWVNDGKHITAMALLVTVMYICFCTALFIEMMIDAARAIATPPKTCAMQFLAIAVSLVYFPCWLMEDTAFRDGREKIVLVIIPMFGGAIIAFFISLIYVRSSFWLERTTWKRDLASIVQTENPTWVSGGVIDSNEDTQSQHFEPYQLKLVEDSRCFDLKGNSLLYVSFTRSPEMNGQIA